MSTAGAELIGPGVTGHALVDLTDEELAALDGKLPEQRLVVTPWLDELSEDQRNLVMLTAFRSLVARGLAQGPDRQALEDALADAETRAGVEIAVDQTVADVLDARDAARRVTTAQRVYGERQDFLYLYEVALPDDGLLLLGELVVPTGLHRLFRVDGRSAAQVLGDFLLPEDWPGAEGEERRLTAAEAAEAEIPDELRTELEGARCQVDTVVLDPYGDGMPVLHGVFAGERGIVTASTPPGEGVDVVFVPRTAAQLRAWVHSEVLP